MNPDDGGYVGHIQGNANGDSWIRYTGVDVSNPIESFEIFYATANARPNRRTEIWIADAGQGIGDAVSIGAADTSASSGNWTGTPVSATCTNVAPHNLGTDKTIFVRFFPGDGGHDLNYKEVVLNFGEAEEEPEPEEPEAPIEVMLKSLTTPEGAPWSGTAYYESHGAGNEGTVGVGTGDFVDNLSGANSWVRYDDVDLQAGILKFALTYASSNDTREREIDVFVADASKRLDGTIRAEGQAGDAYNDYAQRGVAIPAATDGTPEAGSGFYHVGKWINNVATGGWGGPGMTFELNPANDDANIGGVKDVYVRYTLPQDFNFGGLNLTIQPGTFTPPGEDEEPEEPEVPVEPINPDYIYNESEANRPDEADVEPYLRTYHNAPSSTNQTGSDNFSNSGATPIGNGYMGATIYGGVLDDLILINEKTLWSGGAGAVSNYTGGIIPGNAAAAKVSLEKVRNIVDEEVNDYAPGSPTGTYPSALLTASNDSGRGIVAKEIHENLFGTTNGFGSYQELSRIHLLDGLMPAPSEETAVLDSSLINSNRPGSGEPVTSIFTDNDSKWYISNTPTADSPVWVTWGYEEAVAFTRYAIRTANDETGRDPREWTLYGSNEAGLAGDNAEGWVILHDRTGNNLGNARNTKTEFSMDTGNPDVGQPYKYYRMVFTRVRTSGFQISGLLPIFGEEPAQPPAETSLYSNYRRELNLETGITKITYDYQAPGDEETTKFTKEYFMSYPDNVLVMKMSADKPFNQRVALETLQSKSTLTVNETDGIIQLMGQPADQREDGLHFLQQIKVHSPTAGSDVAVSGNGLKVTDTQELIVIMASGTNYKTDLTDSFNFLKNKETAFNEVRQCLSDALGLGYNQLLKNHLEDYQELFGRVDFKIDGVTVPTVPTTSLVGISGNSYNNASPNNKRYIEMLYYQFGRYLLIASSREGSLPANLQGVWAASLNPPWAADYHTNVNLQMNYWPSEPANLAETHLPMLEYVAMQAPRGRLVAQQYHNKPNTDDGYNNKGGGVNRGWTSYHLNNIWGHSGPETYWQGAYAPAGGTWIALDIMENYSFNHDASILAQYYDVLMDAAIFWVDNLWTDTATGKLVASPSYSPEHGPYTFGTTFEQGVIWEIFEHAQKAYEVIGEQGIYDDAFIKEIADAQSQLLLPDVNGVPHAKGFKRTGVGEAGQFMEWPYESRQDALGLEDSGTGKHRHVNHLLMLHPGSLIVPGRSASDDVFAKAMENTLITRTNEGTGWSRAWKMNFWARLRNGEQALDTFAGLLNRSTLPQLFDYHGPFQIDGNFGGTAGIGEMLLQSHGGYIEFIPALPSVWNNGHAHGLKARGNVVVDMDWSGGEITSAVLKPQTSGPITVKYPGISTANITSTGSAPTVTVDGLGTITIDGVAGDEYTITPGAAEDKSTATFQVLPEDATNVEIKVKGIDGNTFAETTVPASGELELANGKYEYTVTADNYVMDTTAEPNFTIADGDKIVDITLAPTTHKVTLRITPPEAASIATLEVKDAEDVIQTETEAGVYQLANGQYSYTATAAGYTSKTGNFTINGGNANVNIPMSALHEVTFTITPADAATNAVVTIEGQTEVSANTFELTNGTYSYEVVSDTPTGDAPDGYIKRTGTFTVNDNDRNIDVSMVAFTGQYEVTFNVTPGVAGAGSKISIQDMATGAFVETESTDKNFHLEAGQYGYTVRHDDYITKMGVINVVDTNITEDVPMISTPSGTITLAGFQGGYFNTGNGGVLQPEDNNWTGMIRPLTWIKYPSTNIAGGIEQYSVILARGNSATTAGFDVRIAPPNAPFEEARSIGSLSQSINTGGWGAPGITITRSGDQILPHVGGTYDVYAVITAGEINFGSLALTLKPMPTEAQSHTANFSTRPAGATVEVKDLEGNIVPPTVAGGKAYNMIEGFYTYTVTADGFGTKTDTLILDSSKSVSVALLPTDGNFDQKLEAEDGTITSGAVVNVAGLSGGKGAGNLTTSVAIGTINATFSNISNVRFTVPREDTGVVPVNVYYDSSVTAEGQAYIAVKSGNGEVKQVALNPTGVSTVFVDMRGMDNTLYVSGIVSPVGGHTVTLDYIAVHSVTIPGSVEKDDDDVAYQQPKNPIIKSIFTADAEAHVWPDNPDKMYIYPSHDIYPSAGCDRMDQYHVYSTEDMENFVDEGEILRYQDLVDAKNDARHELWNSLVPSSINATNLTRQTFMWAPDIAYRDGYYYFYWPIPLNTGSWGSTWVTGVVRSRFPDRDFELIPEEDAYPGWKGYLEGMPSVIDVSVRVFDEQGYICVGGGQNYFQGKLKDNMVELEEEYKTNGLLQVTNSNGNVNNNTAYNPDTRPNSILHRLPHFHEGPSHFERTDDNGQKWYYLIYPGGYEEPGKLAGDGFHYAMSKDPFGFNEDGHNGTSWEYKGVFFEAAGAYTIHGSVAHFKDKDYVVYHSMDLSGVGEQRSVGIEELEFNSDGTIVKRGKTDAGPSIIPGAPVYTRPAGTVYGMKEDVTITGNNTLYKDSAASGDDFVVSDMNGNTTITLNNVDGGSLNPNGKGNRAMLVFDYSTASNLPKMRLNVNGKDYAFINFMRTGGRSFFMETEFTVQALEPSANNTITLTGLTDVDKGFVLNSVEVILFDDSEDARVVGLIKDINYIGAVTLDSIDKIVKAEVAYAELEAEGKGNAIINYSTLTAARAAYEELRAVQDAAEVLITLIDNIGEVTLASEDAIEAARDAYDNSTSEVKDLVTNLSDLEAAETRLAELKAAQAIIDNVIALIDAIGPIELDESQAAIEAATDAYEALSKAQKAKVTNATTLLVAQIVYKALEEDKLTVDLVTAKINAIGTVNESTFEAAKAKIDEARVYYDALKADLKAKVAPADKAALEAAEASYAALASAKATADQAKATEVEGKITAIGTVTLTAESQAKVDAAKTAYDALSDDQKALVTNHDVLLIADATYESLVKEKELTDKLAAKVVEVLIDGIGTVSMTEGSKLKIDYAKVAYDSLTPDQQAFVTTAKKDALEAAETAYQTLVAEAVDAVIAKIEAIGNVEATDASKAKIEEALSAYNALPAEQQALVTNADVIQTALTQHQALVQAQKEGEKTAADKKAADAVIAKIKAIGTVSNNAASKKKIDDAQAAYNALSADQKKLVTNVSVLTAAQATYTKLVAPPKKGDKFNVGNYKYKVVKAATAKSQGSVQVIGATKNTITSIKIGKTVKSGLYTYKITSIGNKAFMNLKNVKRVTIGDNVATIGKDAFRGCTKLTKVTIGKGVKKLGIRAFYGDKKLNSIVIKSTKIKTVGKNAFKGISKKAKIKVPSSRVKRYQKLFKGKGQATTVKISK